MTELERTIINTLGLTEREAKTALEEAREMVEEGMDPQEVLEDLFGLEDDYIEDFYSN